MAAVADVMRFIRFSHTVFALPFALASMLMAAGGLPSGRVMGLILVCLVSARTAAMAFNRWVDWRFDVLNPRTAGRQHLASRSMALALTLGGVAVFVAGCAGLNRLCLALSPVALVLILGYSLMKRVSAGAHLVLGLALAAAPMGAWAAVQGSLASVVPWVLAAGVMLWVAGFDIIYATQDADFDRATGLHSVPARLGVPRALKLAQALHGVAWLILGALGLLAGFGSAYWVAWLLMGAALVYEHRLAGTGDVELVNRAFFQVNALLGAVVLAGIACETWLKH